jgi:NTP pyrophosphatase (non-canonical NTP hydrolase)
MKGSDSSMGRHWTNDPTQWTPDPLTGEWPDGTPEEAKQRYRDIVSGRARPASGTEAIHAWASPASRIVFGQGDEQPFGESTVRASVNDPVGPNAMIDLREMPEADMLAYEGALAETIDPRPEEDEEEVAEADVLRIQFGGMEDGSQQYRVDGRRVKKIFPRGATPRWVYMEGRPEEEVQSDLKIALSEVGKAVSDEIIIEVASKTITAMANLCYRRATAKGFSNPSSFADVDLTLVKTMLIVTELGEFAEDVRKGETVHAGEEMADVVIRILDLSGALGIDLGAEIKTKLAYNLNRPHKHGKLA